MNEVEATFAAIIYFAFLVFLGAVMGCGSKDE